MKTLAILLVGLNKTVATEITSLLKVLWDINITLITPKKLMSHDMSSYAMVIASDKVLKAVKEKINLHSKECIYIDEFNIDYCDLATDVGLGLDLIEIDSNEYRKVGLQLIKHNGISTIDLYLKIGSSKYLCFFSSSEDKTDLEDAIDRLEDKQVTEIYLTNDHYKHWSDTIITKAGTGLDDKGNLAGIQDNVNTLGSIINEIGVTPDIKESVNKAVDVVMDEVTNSDSLSEKIKQCLKNNKDDFKFYFICYLVTYLLEEADWNSPQTVKKVISAALFRDISIPELHHFQHSRLDDVLGLGDIESEVYQKIRKHPIESAYVVDQFGDFFKDARTVIEQHHERPDGSGYPRGLKSNIITPLAAAFILALDVADTFMLTKDQKTVKATVCEVAQRYNYPTFKRHVKALLRKFK